MILRAHQADVMEAGGKARALARAVAAGFDVPPFVVVPAGLEPCPQDLAKALGEVGDGPFAVRSSGLAEDGSADSHAGQFLSLLEVSRAELMGAVAAVRTSGDHAGIAAYRERKGLTNGDRSPAVIIQQMVPATLAGVAFSADPVSGRRDRVVVSAVAGLGDRLVAGEVDGSSWCLSRSTLTPEPSSDDPLLSAAQLRQVAELALRAEQMFAVPQDIEWAFAGERLFLLQSRPITSPLRTEPIADPTLAVFDNSNIVESYPGVVSPLTASFAAYAYARVYTAFVELLGVAPDRIRAARTVFENMLVRVDGRIYYNLGNWHRALAMLPGYGLNRGFMDGMMGTSEPLPPALLEAVEREQRRGLAEYGRVARMGWRLWRAARRLPATAAAFRERLDRALAATRPERIRTMPLTELAAEYRRIEADLLDRWDAPLVNDFLCMIAFGASRRLLERWSGAHGVELLNDVLIGQGDIISARPAQLIRAMGEVAAGDATVLAALDGADAAALAEGPLGPAIAAYIDEFGDRCTEELKLESVTLEEDPRPLFAAIAAAARAKPSVAVRSVDPWVRHRQAFRGRPVRRALSGWLMRWAKARVRDRENLRYERTRIFGRARRVLLAMGAQLHAHGKLDSPRDVFLLTLGEILGAIEGSGVSSDLSGLAAVRRGEMERAEAMPDPPERLLVRGAAFSAAGAPPPLEVGRDERMRQGTGASAGQVRAVARVVADPRTQGVGPGEILVARHTDPGWIALFASAGAIVIERGSLLSHSAIVARELGIPCVVGVKDATRWIADGETVAVDGATGRVERL